MVYDQSIRPYKLVDPQLTAAADGRRRRCCELDERREVPGRASSSASAWAPRSSRSARSPRSTRRPRPSRSTAPLSRDHAAGRVGRHRVRAGALVSRRRPRQRVLARPRGRHPRLGQGPRRPAHRRAARARRTTTRRRARRSTPARSSTSARPNALAPGLVDGSFREMALWTIDDNPVTDSTINLRAEPWSDRLAEDADPSLLFSSYRHGDPHTPLPARLPRRPVRDPHGQRDGQRHRLAAPRRPPLLHGEPSSATTNGKVLGDAAGHASSTASPSASPPSSRAARAARRATPATTCT